MSALMSSMKLSAFPIAALVLFVLVFSVMVIRVMRRSASAEMDAASRIPIEDGVVTGRASGVGETRRAC